jgi:unsaturated chondroitin disaccharide hydrolase
MEPLESRRLMAVTTAGTGLSATYFNNIDLTGASAARIERKVYADFATTPPPPPIAPTTFSARWTGKIKPSFGETYTFYATADDGVRLWVNHKLLIDDWTTHAAREDRGTIALTASRKVDVQLEYFNNTGAASIQFWWSSPSQTKSVVPTSRLYPEAQNLADKVDHTFAFAEQQIALTLNDVGHDANAYPINTKGSGVAGSDPAWTTTGGDGWTAGFFAGEMWQAYLHNPRKAMRLNATAWTKSLSDRTSLGDDANFRIGIPFGSLYALGGDRADRAALLAAADSKMATWNAKVGMFRSGGTGALATDPSGDLGVLLDHAMDMDLLYRASKLTGNPMYRDRATAHLLKLAQNYVRSDGGISQLGYFNSGNGGFVGFAKKQGMSATSPWARGEAWGLYACTAAYRETGNAALLATAKRIASFYMSHSPADGIAWWDFAAPLPTYRDTSAAAVTCSALFELAKIAPDANDRTAYRAYAERILGSLVGPSYLAEGAASHGVLLHGAAFVPRKARLADNSLIYGDYYLLEAMNRYAGIM